jgi:hypothetical protein
MKPDRSLQTTTRLPSTSLANVEAVASASGDVRCVSITSTSCITVAGLKKWIPQTDSGRPVPIAMSMIGIDEVFVASTAPSGRAASSSAKIDSFSSRISGAASMTI